MGGDDQSLASGPLSAMASVGLGGPLQSLIIAGKVHPIETDMLKLFTDNKETIDNYAELA